MIIKTKDEGESVKEKKVEQKNPEEIENRKLIITGDNAHAKKRIPTSCYTKTTTVIEYTFTLTVGTQTLASKINNIKRI